MKKLEATYSVVLRAGLPPREIELLEHFCGRLRSESGEILLHFNCTAIDASHHTFLEMDTFTPGEDVIVKMRIPYHYVLMIAGDRAKAAPGFLTGIESAAEGS